MSSTFIHHANLLSFHPGFKRENDSILIEGDRIKAVGPYDDLRSLIHSNTNILDATGKTVLPGFNDTHIHIWKVGNLKTFMLDLRGVKSLEEMLSMLSDYNKTFPEVSWITARGFNEAAWSNPRIPTKDDLDRVTKEKPIYVIRTCAHIAVVNTKALEISGVDSKTKIPDGGEIRIGADQNPNGIFTETALGLVSNHIPAYTKQELKTMVQAAREEMYSYGITSATDPAVDPVLLETYYEMNRDKQLGFRLHAMPIILPDGSETPFPIPHYFKSLFFTVNTVKFFSDGGLSGQTSALKRNYKNSSNRGILRLNKEQYLRLSKKAMDQGLGVATHAIGDAAIEFVIDIYRELHKTHPDILKRIEHLGLPEKRNLEDMALLNIAASMQSIFLHELGKNFINSLDDEYLKHCYPVKSVMSSGILTALSSDAPVVKNFNPLKGAEAAVTRQDREGNVIGIGEAITVEHALKAYTSDAAKLCGNDDLGILREGKLADLIILEDDPLKVPANRLSEIKVEKTYVGGELVWEKFGNLRI
jgi:predicted amidohydrolase YtcJ